VNRPRRLFSKNSRYPCFVATTLSYRREALHRTVAHLIPKLRCQFA